MATTHHDTPEQSTGRLRAIDLWGQADCDLCGEFLGDPFRGPEVAEFVKPDGDHVLTHAQCGLDQELELA